MLAGWECECKVAHVVRSATQPRSSSAPPRADNNAGHVNLGGLQITRVEDPNWAGIYIADNSTWRTSTAFGSTFDPCPDIMPAGFYAGTLTAGSTTQLFWPATNPA